MELSKPVEVEDGALVARAQTGDREAFSELVRRHQAAVFGVCYRVLGNREDAEDAAQEAFVRAYGKLGGFEGRSTFKTWMLRLTMNISLNERGRRNRPRPEEPPPSPPPTPETELLKSETIDRVHAALEFLNPDHRAAVMLRDLEGLSYRETAEVLEVPEGTAKGWAHRGRAKLKEILS